MAKVIDRIITWFFSTKTFIFGQNPPQEYKEMCCCGDYIDHYPDGHSPVSAYWYYRTPSLWERIKDRRNPKWLRHGS